MPKALWCRALELEGCCLLSLDKASRAELAAYSLFLWFLLKGVKAVTTCPRKAPHSQGGWLDVLTQTRGNRKLGQSLDEKLTLTSNRFSEIQVYVEE
jgi:hypothetical protein